MLISIIVPIYNEERYLEQCITSICNQSYKNIEIILVDDGSTDNSGMICDEFAKKDHRIQVIHQQNKGMNQARREGVLHSHGNYITFVDSDDYIDEVAYEKAIIYMEQEVDMILFGIRKVFDYGKKSEERERYQSGFYDRNRIEKILYENMIWDENKVGCGMIPSLCTKIIKREKIVTIYEKMGKISFDVCEDSAVSFPLITMANEIVILDDIYYNHRQRAQGVCEPYFLDEKFIDKLYSFYKFMYQFFKNNKKLLRQVELYYVAVADGIKKKYGIASERKFNLFPFDKVKKNERIVLYGAGIVGRQYYNQLQELNYCSVVLWVDQNYQNYEDNIYSVATCLDMEFDKIIISIKDPDMKIEIKENLESMGIDSDKIVV